MAVYTFAIILKKSLPGTDDGVRVLRLYSIKGSASEAVL
jgi:hypothetical protein